MRLTAKALIKIQVLTTCLRRSVVSDSGLAEVRNDLDRFWCGCGSPSINYLHQTVLAESREHLPSIFHVRLFCRENRVKKV